jgi:signal transduction histidine kinase
MSPNNVYPVETIMPTPLRVLILEDEPADAELMAQELRRAGFDPEWERVATETEYLALLDPALDLILADHRLPQFDGLLALKLLQERGLDIPFILVSGTIGEELAVSAMKQGASDYLLKDRLARLGQAVAHALEQRRLRSEGKQAEAASRHKSAFLANMSHELRTPLNAILGFSELLAQQTYGPLTQKQARYVDNIHTSGQHLLALINDLLDLSKVEAGKLELHPQAFHLREALEAALHTIRLQAEAKRQLLHLQVADDLSAITADPLRVRQALYNLLSNAVKFTPAGGSITVTARQVHSSQLTVDRARTSDRELSTVDRKPSGDYVEIAVADTGIGIKPDDLPKLFQLFTQLEQTLTKSAQGTGLGLALTKHLVELHGGTIWAESAGEGRGSTFTIWLPLRSPAS